MITTDNLNLTNIKDASDKVLESFISKNTDNTITAAMSARRGAARRGAEKYLRNCQELHY